MVIFYIYIKFRNYNFIKLKFKLKVCEMWI